MAEINSYQGNADLGFGQSTGGGLIGTSDAHQTTDAADKFAQYNFYQNRDKWNRNNELVDQAAQKAAADFAFKLGDQLEGDSEQVLDAIGNFNKFYTDNPSSVKPTVGDDGRYTNAAAHAQYNLMKTKIDYAITRANVRKTQFNALSDQINKITDSSDREKAMQWMEEQKKTPLSQDIMQWPDFKLFDINAYVKQNMPEFQYPDIKRNPNDTEVDTYKAVDLNAFNSRAQTDYYSGSNDAFKSFVDDSTENFNDIIDKVKEANPDLEGEDLLNAIKKAPGGDAVYDMYTNMNNYLSYYNSDKVQSVVKTGKIDPVDITDGISPTEMMMLFGTTKLTNTKDAKVQQTDNAIEYDKIKKDYGIAAMKLGEDKRQFDKEYQLKKDAADEGKPGENIANDKLSYVLGTLLAPHQTHAKEDPVSGGYAVPVDRVAQEVFQKMLPAKKTVKSGDAMAGEPVSTTTVDKYNIRDIRVFPDESGDLNKTRIKVYYNDPSTPKTVDAETFSAQKFYDLSNNMFGTSNASKVSSASSKLLKKQFNKLSPDFNEIIDSPLFSGAKSSAQNNAPAPAASKPTATATRSYPEEAIRMAFSKGKKAGETYDQFKKRKGLQ